MEKLAKDSAAIGADMVKNMIIVEITRLRIFAKYNLTGSEFPAATARLEGRIDVLDELEKWLNEIDTSICIYE